MRPKTQRSALKKLRLSRETLQALDRNDLIQVAGGAPTEHGLMCNTFSDPSVCATCLCTL